MIIAYVDVSYQAPGNLYPSSIWDGRVAVEEESQIEELRNELELTIARWGYDPAAFDVTVVHEEHEYDLGVGGSVTVRDVAVDILLDSGDLEERP